MTFCRWKRKALIHTWLWGDRMFGSLKALNSVVEQLKQILEREDIQEKLRGEGVKGKLEIEGYKIYFLIRKEEENE